MWILQNSVLLQCKKKAISNFITYIKYIYA
ncbi:hypothetical protein GGR07_001667 [Bacteroides pyogenes]|nr:hypothetical protein [Bacteroides pyogenes]SUV70668.1 Uncharacterised protein [Bacteroides pyogenes]